MNILSIDFDYFQDATESQLAEYPDDTISISGNAEMLAWALRYTSLYDALGLKKIKISTKFLKKMEDLLLKMPKYIPVMICNQHIEIVPFIRKYLVEHYEEEYVDFTQQDLHIYNVDLHHDMFGPDDEKLTKDTLHNGNWIKFMLAAKEPTTSMIKWFCRSVSIDAYKLNDFARKAGTYLAVEGLKDLEDTEFGGIFLCKSSTWLPPHLDKHFDELVHVIKDHFNNVKMSYADPLILNRYSVIKKTAKEMDEKLNVIKKQPYNEPLGPLPPLYMDLDGDVIKYDNGDINITYVNKDGKWTIKDDDDLPFV